MYASEHVRYVLDSFLSPYVGLCYDSGHEHIWSPDIDWLNEYGTIDWIKKSKQIAKSSYTGAITIESKMHASQRYEKDGLDSFLSYAYEKGKKLAKAIYQHQK